MILTQITKTILQLVSDLAPYFVKKSGDTMTGTLTMTTHGGSWISQATAEVPIEFTPPADTGGARYDAFMRGTFADNSTWALGGIYKKLYFAYWTAGRTANGNDGEIALDVANSSIELTRNDYNDTTVPTSSLWMDSIVGYDGKGAYSRFNIRQVAHANTRQGLQLEAHRQVNGTNYYNGIQLLIDNAGTPIVELNQAAAWRNALGKYTRSSVGALDWSTYADYFVTNSALAYWNGAYSGTNSNLTYCAGGTIARRPTVLYNNGTGTNGTVGLSSSAANFNHMRIFFKKNGDSQARGSLVVFSPNGNRFGGLVVNSYSSSGGQFLGRTYTISGTSISAYNGAETFMNTDTGGSFAGGKSNTTFYIYRVEAWND